MLFRSYQRINRCTGEPPAPPRKEACKECAKSNGVACNGVGICDEDDGTCTCPTRWSGESCEQCASGMFGEVCEKECPGGARTPCLNHGTCDMGVEGTGVCVCSSNWAGEGCGEGAEGYEGDDCTRTQGVNRGGREREEGRKGKKCVFVVY